MYNSLGLVWGPNSLDGALVPEQTHHPSEIFANAIGECLNWVGEEMRYRVVNDKRKTVGSIGRAFRSMIRHIRVSCGKFNLF